MDLCRPLKLYDADVRRRAYTSQEEYIIHGWNITCRSFQWIIYWIYVIILDWIYICTWNIKDYDADRRSQERRRRKVCELHTLKYSVQQFYVSALCVNITSCYNACVFKVWLIDGACPADINIRLGTIRTYELRIWITYRTYYHKKLKYSEYVINSPLKISVMGVCPADISTQWVRNNYKTSMSCLFIDRAYRTFYHIDWHSYM